MGHVRDVIFFLGVTLGRLERLEPVQSETRPENKRIG